jgi:hypothetical protein
MPQNHERKRQEPGRKEGQPQIVSYYIAATFQTRQEGQEPHKKVKRIIEHDDDLEVLSSFLFERKPHDPKAPPLQRPWHVVILGETPPEPVQQQFQEILSAGELTQLSLETLVTLADRRAREARPGMYREGQHEPGVLIPEATIKFRRKPKRKGRRRK